MDFRADICPTFMTWAISHGRHRCNLRHPSYRYLERPKQKASSPQPANEEPKPRQPNSYATVLAKNKPTEPKKFCVDLRSDRITKNTLEEEWPALGSPEQGLTIKGPDERSKATADQLENDRLFAENLQDSEYTQFSEQDENDEDNYNPEEQNEKTSGENEEDNYNQEEESYDDNDGDNCNPEEQEEETNGKNEFRLTGTTRQS